MNCPSKGIYYLGGLTEGAKTIAVLAAFCLFAGAIPVIAYVIAALCTVTTSTRGVAGVRARIASDEPVAGSLAY